MSDPVNVKKIKPAENYGPMKDKEIQNLGLTVAGNLLNNTSLPNSPVDPKVLKTDCDNLGEAIVASQDGSKKAIAEKNKLRAVVIKDLRLIGRYVEETANGDMATFRSSGLTPTSGTRQPPVQLSATFRSVKHGKVSGQIVIRLKAVSGATSYEIRYAAVANGVPGNWTTQLVPGGVQTPVTLNGLTPGVLYAFQSHSMGKSGYSDYGDSVTLMAI